MGAQGSSSRALLGELIVATKETNARRAARQQAFVLVDIPRSMERKVARAVQARSAEVPAAAGVRLARGSPRGSEDDEVGGRTQCGEQRR